MSSPFESVYKSTLISDKNYEPRVGEMIYKIEDKIDLILVMSARGSGDQSTFNEISKLLEEVFQLKQDIVDDDLSNYGFFLEFNAKYQLLIAASKVLVKKDGSILIDKKQLYMFTAQLLNITIIPEQ